MSYKNMSALLKYYQKEMSFLSTYISEFSETNNSIDWLNERSPDPHLQKLIESFALISAKLNYKIDYANSDLNRYIIDMLLPQFNRPIPANSVVSIDINPKTEYPAKIPANTEIEASGIKFKTAYDMDIIPFQIESIQALISRELGLQNYQTESSSFLKIKLKKLNLDLKIPKKIRFYFNKKCPVRKSLYSFLFSESKENDIFVIEDKSNIKRIKGNKSNITNDFAFGDNREAFDVKLASDKFKMIHDYFTFEEKFMFFDVYIGEVDCYDCLEIVLPLSNNSEDLNLDLIKPDSLKLMSSPVVNLYKTKSAPVEINYKQEKYKIKTFKPDKNTIIYAIPKIESINNAFKYLKYFKHHYLDKKTRFWSHIRRVGADNQLNSYINIVDLNKELSSKEIDVVVGDLICCNKSAEFDIKKQGIAHSFKEVRFDFVLSPSAVNFFPQDASFDWYLISHLVTSHIGMVSSDSDESLCDIKYVKNLIKIYQTVFESSTTGVNKSIISCTSKKSYSFEIFDGVQCHIPTWIISIRIDDKMQKSHNILLFTKVLFEIFNHSVPFNVKIIVDVIKDSNSSLWRRYV